MPSARFSSRSLLLLSLLLILGGYLAGGERYAGYRERQAPGAPLTCGSHQSTLVSLCAVGLPIR